MVYRSSVWYVWFSHLTIIDSKFNQSIYLFLWVKKGSLIYNNKDIFFPLSLELDIAFYFQFIAGIEWLIYIIFSLLDHGRHAIIWNTILKNRFSCFMSFASLFFYFFWRFTPRLIPPSRFSSMNEGQRWYC